MNQDQPVSPSSELNAAIEAEEPETVRGLLQRGADPDGRNPEGWPFLLLAVDQASADIVDTLLEYGADPRAAAEGITAVLMATLRQDHRSISSLIRRGADVNRPDPEGLVPLKAAATAGDLRAARLLLDADANIEYAGGLDDMSVLGAAVSGGHVDMVRLLLDRGADPRARDVMHQLPVDQLPADLDPPLAEAIRQLLGEVR